MKIKDVKFLISEIWQWQEHERRHIEYGDYSDENRMNRFEEVCKVREYLENIIDETEIEIDENKLKGFKLCGNR